MYRSAVEWTNYVERWKKIYMYEKSFNFINNDEICNGNKRKGSFWAKNENMFSSKELSYVSVENICFLQKTIEIKSN